MRGLGWIGVVAVDVVLVAPELHAQSDMLLAQERYRRGVELFLAERYAPALNEFQMSLQLYASPNAQLFVARCLARLDRPVQALAAFERAARDAEDRARSDPRYVATRDAARAELREAEQRVGRLTITLSDPPGDIRITVEGTAVPPAALGLPLPVVPGLVSVSASAAGYAPFERQVVVEAGRSEQLTVTLRASDSPANTGSTRPLTTHADPSGSGAVLGAGWTGLSIGVLGLAGFGVTYGLAVDQYHQLERQCPAATGCTSSPDAAIARGSALEIAAYTSLAVGVTTAAIGVALLIAGSHRTTTPHVVLAPGFLGVTGVF